MTENKYELLSGGGEMGELIRNKEWNNTALGNIEKWDFTLLFSLSIILNSKFPMFIFWGPELRCFYNDAYRPSLGNDGKHPRMLGEKAEEFWVEIWDTIKPQIDKVINTGESTWNEDSLLPIYRNNMLEDVFWTYSYSPIKIENGNVEGVFVTCVETTDKVKSLISLQESEEQLQFTLNAAELATWDLNPKTNKFVGNSRIKQWFGISVNQEIDLPIALNCIIPADRERVVSAINAALTPGSDGKYQIEYRIINSDDYRKRAVRAVGQAVFDSKNNPVRFSGILEDITEQMENRDKILELKERFETMANNIPNLSWIANSDGYIFWYNTRWYEYTGTTPQDMEGWGWKTVHDPVLLPEVLDKWQYSINSGQPFEMVFPLKGADGIFRPFLTRVVPIRNMNDEVIRWVGTNTDITAQKEVEKMKDNFLSMASHELKTPVTTIKAYAQIARNLLEEKKDIQISELIKKVEIHTDKLTKIISDLLDVNIIQQDKLSLKFSSFDYKDLIQEVIDDMSKLIASHKIIYDIQETITIQADIDKISQVVNNLITNAVKYSPGKDKIIINTKIAEKGIQLSVQDFGIGISKANQDEVFNQFYRVTGDNQSQFSGMGIGLYISSEIIKKHNGKMWLESEEGNGTTMYVILPLNRLKSSLA